MGQAWCKEKSTKAQDSKSPLDRVFVRCAHRIYPGLKEDGSVLGSGGIGGGGGCGATQRVTSSEIGYAGSPPRASLLQRGQSIDSVDRPFHPSDWVDVNLEVPCTPRASVTQQPLRRTDDLPANARANGPKSNGKEKTPVPPPRRRRRTRDRRPLPPKPGVGDTADEESEAEPEPLYSKLTSKPRPVQQELESADEIDGPDRDSDEEFEAIERSLEKSLQDELSTSPETCEKSSHVQPATSSTTTTTANARPKNHSTTSLPNVAELLAESGSSEDTSSTTQDDAAAKRPPRHVKTASLPRDTSLCAPQTPERTVFPKRSIEADTSKASDNSIFEEPPSSADCSQLGFEADVETSTPVKPTKKKVEKEDEEEVEKPKTSREVADESRELTFESCTETSKSSVVVEAVAAVPAIPHDVDRPANAVGDQSTRSDVGYESRSPQAGSHPFSDGSSESRARLFGPDDDDESEAEMSSGILRDATVDSTNTSQLEPDENHVAVVAMLQRTISEESLPHEMLVDGDLDEEEDDEKSINEHEVSAPGEMSVKDANNQLTRQTSAIENGSINTPPPTPERAAATSNGPVVIDSNPFNLVETSKVSSQLIDDSSNNPASMTPSLMELEAALTDMLERKDEAEREGEDDEEVSSPEPQIVPVGGGGGGGLRRLSPQSERKREREIAEKKAAGRPIDFHRQNPFNDLLDDDCSRDRNSPTDDPPEKPHRLHRVSLIEDSNIEEPLIVPTPPRRRHRSKSSNLNSSGDSATIPALHTYASGDRLI